MFHFNFRRRTNATSHDPYDCLTTSHIPRQTNQEFTSDDESSSSAQQFMNQDEYWTNGTTVQFFNIASNSSSSSSSSSRNCSTQKNIMKKTTDSFGSDHNVEPKRIEKRNLPQMNNVNDMKKTNNNFYEIRNSIIAGSVAGITSCAIFHPFDVVRTKMQASTKIFESATTISATTLPNNGAATSSKASVLRNGINASSGPLAVMSHTYRNGGLRAFYTGIGLPLAAQALYKSTVFTTNRISMNVLTEWKTTQQRKTGIFAQYQLTPLDHFICGATSGAVNALLFVSPVEYVRNQLIHQHTKRAEGTLLSSSATMKGPTDVIKKTLRTEGILGLWKGAGVTLVRDSIGCGAFFIMNDFGGRYISRTTGHNEDTLLNKIGSGFMAGFGYWFVSLPADALKTLVQTGKASSAVDTLYLLVGRDGILDATRQLYRGWQLAFGRGSPSAAVTLTTYSIAYNFCDRRSSTDL